MREGKKTQIYCGIGGQAVIEGIMMKNGEDYAVGVRKPDGEITVKKERYVSLTDRYRFLRLPLIRGVFSFWDSLRLGMRCLSFSASFFEDDEGTEASAFEKWMDRTFGERAASVLSSIVIAFSFLAALLLFVLLPTLLIGQLKRFLPSESFRSTVESVLSGEADFAVLPIENSSYGAVADNFDLLLQFPEAVILGECFLPVEHVLMALPGGTLSGIRRVFSHPQALAQCESFFREHPRIEAVPARNTAEAARRVRESGERELAALASENAAEIYGLSILQRAVNQQKSNTTRFLIVGKEKIYERGAERLSLSFELSHRPGALYHVLGSFLFNDLNLSMIQSRPVPDRPFEYRFFVDVMGNLSDPDVRNALSELPGFRILGNYSDFSDAFPRKAAFPAERIKGGI